MPPGEGRRFSCRDGCTVAQGVVSYQPWQGSVTAKGTLTSQQEGESAGRQLLQLSRQADRTQERVFFWLDEGSNLTLPSGVHLLTFESETLIHGEKAKEGDRHRANGTPSLDP